MKKKFIVIHNHEYGTSIYGVVSDKELTGYLNEENLPEEPHQCIFNKLKIDFEPEGAESIDIVEFGEFVEV